jgi:hypothetical protein
MTRETVAGETPACFATSEIVAAPERRFTSILPGSWCHHTGQPCRFHGRLDGGFDDFDDRPP